MRHAWLVARGALAVMATMTLSALIGCRDRETVASRSAKEFSEAQRRGESFAGAGHAHGHGAEGNSGQPMHTATGHETSDAKSSSTTDMRGHPMGAMSGHDPGHEPGQPTTATPGGERSHEHLHAMGGTPNTTEGARHGHAVSERQGATGAQSGEMPGHSMAGMGHERSNPQAPPNPAPAAGFSAPRGGPAATLEPDRVDSPAPTSVAESQRSAQIGSAMGGMTGMAKMHGGAGYRQSDVGREPQAAPPEHTHESPPPPAHQRRGVGNERQP